MALQKVPGRATALILAADPVTGVPATGDCWYNSTDKYLKFKVGEAVVSGGTGTWSVGGTTIQVLKSGDGSAGFGTLLAGCVWGGRQVYAFVSDGGSVYSDEYDGSSFAASGNMPSKVWENAGGLGSQTAGLQVGGTSAPGYTSGTCQEYDGTTWTAAPNLSPGSGNGIWPSFSGGSQTAGYVAGGNTGTGIGNSYSFSAATYEYNGSTWTTTTNLLLNGITPYGGSHSGSTGTQTAGLAVGGNYGPPPASYTDRNTTEEYDGTTWTAGGNLSVTRGNCWNTGIQTDAYATGGTAGNVMGVKTTEGYDGTAWSQVSSEWADTTHAARNWYRYSGAGYSGTGTFSNTGFSIMSHLQAATSEGVGYCEEFGGGSQAQYTADVIHRAGAQYTVHNSSAPE